MILPLFGTVLILLGLFSGGMLVASPLGYGPPPAAAGIALWVLFPLFSLIGYLLVAAAGRTSHVRGLSLLVSGLLLALALVSAIGLVLAAASMLHPAGSLISLVYVLVVAGVLGTLGMASFNRSAQNA